MQQLHKPLDPTRVGDEAEKLAADLHKRIVGQDEAIQQIVNIYQMHMAGMSSPGRPIGNFLFLGPTGSGKTRLVEATAESLLGDARAVIKIDCAEFQHSHETAKLIGSPPGYLGHRQTHALLSQEMLNQFHSERVRLSFVLFDEIEKASDALWNLLLGILDKATLTLGDNSRVDFAHALIFMTSNLGAAEMDSILRPKLGFASTDAIHRGAAGTVDENLMGKITRAGMEAARRKFTPEFMNRIDKAVVFRPLADADLRKILTLELSMVQQRVFSSGNYAPFVFSLTDPAKDFLLREGTDMKYGARHLKRAIDRNLVHPLSNLVATEQIRGGDLVRVDYDGGTSRLTFVREAAEMPSAAMAHATGLTVSAVTIPAAPQRSASAEQCMKSTESAVPAAIVETAKFAAATPDGSNHHAVPAAISPEAKSSEGNTIPQNQKSTFAPINRQRLRSLGLLIFGVLCLVGAAHLSPRNPDETEVVLQDVRQMLALEMPETVIATKIDHSGRAFALNTDAIVGLKKAGASISLVNSLMRSAQRWDIHQIEANAGLADILVFGAIIVILLGVLGLLL